MTGTGTYYARTQPGLKIVGVHLPLILPRLAVLPLPFFCFPGEDAERERSTGKGEA